MTFLFIEVLIIIVLVMILSMLIIDERKKRSRNMRVVTLKGYWNGTERRSLMRLNVSLEVKYFTNSKPIYAKSVDISTKGIRLLLDEKIEKGTPLRLEIKLPGEEHLIKARGDVVWTEESIEDEKESAKRLFNTGIQFGKFQNSDDKRLFNFVHSL